MPQLVGRLEQRRDEAVDAGEQREGRQDGDQPGASETGGGIFSIHGGRVYRMRRRFARASPPRPPDRSGFNAEAAERAEKNSE